MIDLEPGRSLVGNAGVCLTEVLYLKPGEQKNFLHRRRRHERPAAPRDVPGVSPHRAGGATRGRCHDLWDVVGPVCESGDWLGRDRALAVQAGDLLAVLSAGAYCMSMASNYNTRGRAAEVLVDGGQATLIRERETGRRSAAAGSACLPLGSRSADRARAQRQPGVPRIAA